QNARNDPRATYNEVPLLLCPSDPSSAKVLSYGRCSYMANLGGNGNMSNASPSTGGPFYVNSKVAITQITDAASNTAMFSETKRGYYPTANAPLDCNIVSGWDTGTAGDVTPPAGCNSPGSSTLKYSGLEYFRGGLIITAYYTHTVPPNNPLYDCSNS